METLTFLKSILLGIFQGLTEFLPVSSSGHLMLLGEIFGLDIESAAVSSFTVFLHLGTLLAVVIVYFKQLINMVAHPIKGDLKWLVIATLPTVIYALFIKATGWEVVIDETARDLLPFAFLLTAVLLVLADGIAKNRKIAKTTHKTVRFSDSLGMGLMQCVGTFSGVSRSGSTITAGLACGLNRTSAADFSFLMSVPAILGAAVLEGYEMLGNGELAACITSSAPMVTAGILAALVSGLIAIKLMLHMIKKLRLKWFSVYLVLLAAVILVNDFVTKLW